LGLSAENHQLKEKMEQKVSWLQRLGTGHHHQLKEKWNKQLSWHCTSSGKKENDLK